MKRRDFFKKGLTGAAALGGTPLLAANVSQEGISAGDRSTDNWFQVATGTKGVPRREHKVRFKALLFSLILAFGVLNSQALEKTATTKIES